MKLANAVKRCFKRSNSGNGGSWATDKDIRSLLKTPENGGVVIGGYAGQPLVYGGANHVVAVGGLKSGMANLVIQTLMTYKGSVVVHDIRGEFYNDTAEHRRAIWQKVIRFAPGEDGSPRFNPMDTVRFGTEHESDDVKNVAAAVCPPDDHWAKWAFCIITALLLHGISERGRAFTLADAYQLSQRPGIVDELAHSTVSVARETAKGMLRVQGPHELSGIMSTVTYFLGVYGDASIAQTTSASDFSLDELQNGDTPVTLYLVSDYADTKRVTRVHQALLALIIKRDCPRRPRFQDGHIVPHYRHKLLLLLDNYNRFERGVYKLADGLAFMSGYGIQSYITVRIISRDDTILENLNREGVMANSHIRIFFRPDFLSTAEYISKQLGDVVEDGCRKPLLTPDEVLRLPPGPAYRTFYGITCLTLRAGNAPIFGEAVPCWSPFGKRMQHQKVSTWTL
ncbi:hypothetical protein BBC27_07805 [Acidithiobacillus ferrivorans]|uniref:Type IV secretion system coupling protein TraD DNA-binding domain-containing protein n=1 Tax=Acidithiobacillus ferrivorans TaxID=160808 RepID=A0A1B9C0H3_9PROT|nr:type IV secretory system conjugative DNA transfer family protein [Acidithiobacillus ferrivorans]OCB03458.1 hypothetical protein BBC27_07805 [Acidithiobacillus ferrivorans]